MVRYNFYLEQRCSNDDDDGEHRPGHGWLGQSREC